jgi:RNA polymerase sigma-70 factor (ECF subfamily)
VSDLSSTTDGELVSKTRSNDADAFRELVGRYQGHVYGLAYSLVGNWVDAQDITQETFIRAYLDLDKLRDPGRFAPWLRRVAFGTAMNWLRAFRPGLYAHMDGRADLDELEIPDFRPGPAELVERRELADAVLRAVQSLPPKYRMPLAMFHLDGLSYQKVAEFLDIPLGTAKSLIHRAREKLKVVLATYAPEEVAPMVQEVFNEHKLPEEFTREIWGLCMDWLCAGDQEMEPAEPKDRKERAERIALAAARDPDVAMVNRWRKEAEPIPDWALAVDKETPRWAIEFCNHAWIQQIERLVWMIGNETALPDPAPGRCGSVSAARLQWSAQADRALNAWLEGESPSGGQPASEIYSLLGAPDKEKAEAVRLLRYRLRLSMGWDGEDLEAKVDELAKRPGLTSEMADAFEPVRSSCGYRWEKTFLDVCRAIGDPEFRSSKPLRSRIRECGNELRSVYEDDPMRVPTTCAYLVGVWAWLKGARPEALASLYPSLAEVAEGVRRRLGQMTPVKRWLAGRFFVGLKIWLYQLDFQIDLYRGIDPEAFPGHPPALEPYPALTAD